MVIMRPRGIHSPKLTILLPTPLNKTHIHRGLLKVHRRSRGVVQAVTRDEVPFSTPVKSQDVVDTGAPATATAPA